MCEQHVVYFNLFPTGIFGVFLVNDNKIVHQLPGQSQNLKKKKKWYWYLALSLCYGKRYGNCISLVHFQCSKKKKKKKCYLMLSNVEPCSLFLSLLAHICHNLFLPLWLKPKKCTYRCILPLSFSEFPCRNIVLSVQVKLRPYKHHKMFSMPQFNLISRLSFLIEGTR